MKTRIYSFYSSSHRTYVNVKAESKKHVVIFAREILGDNVSLNEISIVRNPLSHAESIESSHSYLF